jgi:hypothetical protein
VTDYAKRIGRLAFVGTRLLGISILLALVGGVTIWISGIGQAVFAADRAGVGEALTFEATGGDYQLVLLADPLGIQFPYRANPLSGLRCEVETAGGSTIEIDGSRALSRTETDAGVEIGGFTAPAGPTIATCRFIDGGGATNYFYSVAPASSVVGSIATIVLVVGVAGILAGAVMLVLAYQARGRLVTPTEGSPPA